MVPPNHTSIGSRAYSLPSPLPSLAPCPEPYAAAQAGPVAKSASNGDPSAVDQALSDLKKAFLRQSAQVRADRARRDQDLDESTDD